MREAQWEVITALWDHRRHLTQTGRGGRQEEGFSEEVVLQLSMKDEQELSL